MTKNKARRPRTKPLVRHILSFDGHDFVGWVQQLGIVAYNFESYEELSQHTDCKYAYDVGDVLTNLTRRVESLNMVGDLLWPSAIPEDIQNFPVSRYEWLVISADVFLMRYVSVLDCVLLLTNEVFEMGLQSKKCSLKNIRKKNISSNVLDILDELGQDHDNFKNERNLRFHRGVERGFTEDDQTFKTAALFEHRYNGIHGNDRFGRKINVERFFKEGLVELQRDFNQVTRKLVRQLDRLYGEFEQEFGARFSPRYAAASHDFGTKKE